MQIKGSSTHGPFGVKRWKYGLHTHFGSYLMQLILHDGVGWAHVYVLHGFWAHPEHSSFHLQISVSQSFGLAGTIVSDTLKIQIKKRKRKKIIKIMKNICNLGYVFPAIANILPPSHRWLTIKLRPTMAIITIFANILPWRSNYVTILNTFSALSLPLYTPWRMFYHFPILKKLKNKQKISIK